MKVNPVGSNMTEVETMLNSGKTAKILFSYKTPVAACIEGVCYKTAYKWSVTTSRHINKWLDGMTAEVMPQSFFDDLETNPM